MTACGAASCDLDSERTVRKWFDRFSADDDELYTNAVCNAKATEWALANIPRFECPDPEIERTYYFRWWTYRKHLRRTPGGWVVTEFLPTVRWAGKGNTISCALNHHVLEGRWLRDGRYIDDYLHFMLTEGRINGPLSYSCAPAWAALERAKVTDDYELLKRELPRFVENCERWEKGWKSARGNFFFGFRPERGLYDIIDGHEGTECSLSGHGARPMVNSMRWADMSAVAEIARMAGDADTAARYGEKAAALERRIKEVLWNREKRFFTMLSVKGELSGVCELHGYAPFYFGMKLDGFGEAWRPLMSEKGFYAPRGLTFPARDTPRFRVHPDMKGHECQWNGPSWPYSTSVALTALSRSLQSGIDIAATKDDFFTLLKQYAAQHVIILEDGRTVPWIDENLDAFTGEWLARKIMIEKDRKSGKRRRIIERGKDYNHSTFCDIVISGLCGIRADAKGELDVKPLAPEDWDWWRIDGVRWHGRDLKVLFDRDGTRYNCGKGLVVNLAK